MYYKFNSLQDAQLALDYVNRTLLSLFPEERQSPEGLISVDYNGNLLPNSPKTTTWANIQEFEDYWIFLIPTESNVFLPIPELNLPVEYTVISEEEFIEIQNLNTEKIPELNLFAEQELQKDL